MRRTKPQLIFLSCDHPQHSDATFKQIELCGGDLHAKHNFRSVLTNEHLKLLGETDEDWFENAAKEFSGVCEGSRKAVGSSTKQKQDENPIATLARSKDEAVRSHLCLQETPVRKDAQFSNISELDSSPPLFTPDQKGKTLHVTDTACHSTPSVTAESQTFSPLKGIAQDPNDYKIDSSVNLPSLGISPLGDGGPNPREDTPQVLRNLMHLQTPSTANKTQETLSMSALQQTLPTPQRLSKSLGAEVNDLNFSWTSSMATPFSARKTSERDLTCVRTTSSVARGTDSPQTWKPIIAKVLFAGCEKKVQTEPKSLEREESSETLQSLHFSSTEDEAEASDQEKDDLDPGKKDHHSKRRKKDGSFEIKRMKKVKEWKDTPLKVKMEGPYEEKRKMGKDLGCGGSNLMKGRYKDGKEDVKASDVERGSPEKKQKIEEDLDAGGKKEMQRVLELKMEKGEGEIPDVQLEDLCEDKSGEKGDNDDCDLGKKMESVEVNDGNEKDNDKSERNMKCDERRESIKTGEMEIHLEEKCGMEKYYSEEDVDETEGERDGDTSKNEMELSTSVDKKGGEKAELYHEDENGDEMGASVSNQMEEGCVQMIESKVNTEIEVRLQEIQKVQNGLDEKRADGIGHGTSSNAVTLDDAEKGEELAEHQPSEVDLSKMFDNKPNTVGSIPKEKDKSEKVTSKFNVKASGGEEGSNTTQTSSTQNRHVKQHAQDILQTPRQNLQRDNACVDKVDGESAESATVEDNSIVAMRPSALGGGSDVPVMSPVIEGSVAVMSPSAEAGLYGRLAILAETLNIPLAQMIEADKKARKLQEAALRKATPPSNGTGMTYKPSQDIETPSRGNLSERKLQNQTAEKETTGREHSSCHEVSAFEAKNEKEEPEEKIIVKSAIQTDTNSPPSLLPDGSQSNGSQKSLNIADTLAFFLATPPLTQKRKASLGQVPPATASHCKTLSETGDEMGVSKIEERSENDIKLSGSPPALTKKDAVSITPPQVGSSPNACLFSPLTPSTTEALLRATDAVSSSLESSGESKDIEVNNNACQGNEECNILEASLDHLKERSMENEAEMGENVLSTDQTLKSAEDGSVEEENSSMLTKDGELKGDQEKGKKDLSPRNNSHEEIDENGEKLDISQEDVDSPVSFLKVGKSLSARRFLYPVSDTKLNIKPRLLAWQQKAVLDELFLEEGEKEISDTTKDLSETGKKLENGASEKLFNRSKTGQFQTFNSFLQSELKEGDRLGCPLQKEKERINETFTKQDLKRTAEEVTNLSSRTKELCDLNEGFLTDPPELIHNVRSPPSGEGKVAGGGGDVVPLSHKMGPGGDSSFQSYLCVEDLEEERRCRKEVDEKKHQRSCEGERVSSESGKSEKNGQIPVLRKLSNDRSDNVSLNSGSRMDENVGKTIADTAKDVPAAEESDMDNLLGDRTATLHTKANEMSSLTEQFACGDTVSVPDKQTDPPFVGFRSALGKKIPILASAIEKAKLFMQELELVEPVVTQDKKVTNLSSDNVELENHDSLSLKLDVNDGKFNQSEKAVFAGFTSGSGRPIQISAKALKDAELLLEKFESEDLEIASSTEEQKSKISVDMGSGKSEDTCQESSDGNGFGHDNLRTTKTSASKIAARNVGGATNENSSRSKNLVMQGGFAKPAHRLSKKYDPSKNYNHLPKGFRPFKPPARRLVTGESSVGAVQKLNKYPEDSPQGECQKQNCEEKEITQQGQKEDVVGTVPSCNDRIKTKISEVDGEEFGEEENEAHIVREIAAAEEAEMLYDFMNDDDDIVDTQIDTLLTASTEEVKVLKQDEVTFDLRSQVKETGVPLGNVEKSQNLLGVNRSNVCLSSDVEIKLASARKFAEREKQSVTLLSHDQDMLRNVEQSKMSDISNDPVEVSNLAGNTPTTQTGLLDSDGREVKGFVGFQTAKGKKIEISDEALVNAKQFLLEEDFEVSNDPLISSFPVTSENDKALKTSALHKVKEKPSPDVDKKFKPIQREKRKSILKTGEVSNPKKIKTSDTCTASSSVKTGNGKKVRFSEESLKSVQMALEAEVRSENDSNGGCGFSEDEVRKRSVENLKGTLYGGDGPCSSFTGFQTGNGKQVTISKEALDRARQTWCDEGLVADCDTEGAASNMVLSKHEGTSSSCSPKFFSAPAGYQSHKGNQSLDGPHFTQAHTSVTDTCNKESGGLVQTLNSDLLNNSLPPMKTGEGEDVDGKDGERNFSETGSEKMECRIKEKSRKLPADLQSGPPGFQTASGVSIKISELALEKARKLWSEDDNVTEWIQVEKSKKHTEAVLKDEANAGCVLKGSPFNKHKIVSHATLGKINQNLHTSLEQGMFSGFQTASGSKVKVSASSLEKAKNLLSDDEDEETSTNPSKKCGDMQDQTSEGVETTFIGFQTAKGTKVSISDAALEKAQKFLSEEGLAIHKKQNSSLSTNDEFGRLVGRNLQGKMYSGFQTGRGSKVKISVTALERAKSLWSEDMDIDPPGKRRKLDNSLDRVNIQREPEIEETCNFQTAGGSKVKVSQEALEKARSHWSEDEIDLQPQKSEEKKKNPESLASSAAVGFQTANGSKISISSSALEEAKKFLEEDDSLLRGSHKTTIHNFPVDPEKKHFNDFPIPQTKFSGFQTGNGAKVEISTAAMERAKQLWSDDVDFGQDKKIGTLLSTNQKSSQMISGFQTAKGSSVTVSHAALQKAQSLFAEEEDNRSCLDFKKNTKGEEVDGSNSVVKECQSLKSLKGMKEYYPGVNRSMVPSASGSQFGTVRGNAATSGFLTGRGKAVAISESSLREAKAKWDDQRDSGSLNMAEKFVSLPHEERVLRSGFGVTLKEQKTGERPSTSSVNCDGSVHHVSGNTSKDSTLLQEERRCKEGIVCDQYKEDKPGLNMNIHPKNEAQISLAWGQSASVAGLRAADTRGGMRHGHTSQFTSKVRKGSSPGNSPVTKLGSHHLPQRSSPASVLSDRTSPAHPLVTSGPLSESVIREPPTNARIFKKRINMETSYNEKSHENVCLKQVWQQARMSQSKRIQDKKKTAIKPKPGYLSKHRKGKQRVSLRDAVDQTLPNHLSEKEILCAGVLPSTLNISSQSSSAYRFKAGDFFSHETLASPEGVLLGDGGRLVPSDDGTVGAEEFKNALFDTPGVDPALVSPDWVENHFRWIVWKLASMEVAYPTHFGGRLLTPDRVLLQLKHRYDREIDQSQRSVLKKILERDEAASRRMVLCVAGILEPQSLKEDDRSEKNDDKSVKDTNKSAKQNCHLLLTDGWYAVKTMIDTPLAAQVEYGKICIGTKLCLSGGELVGSQDACSPLEIPENLFFRIFYNSTRRAKFDACLGIQKDPRPFPVPLKSVCGSGGTVGCVDIVIARVYPMLYMEKYPDGSSVFRSLRAEERAAAEFSKAKQRRMETLYSQIQKKYEEKKRKESQPKKVKRSCKFTQEEVNAMTTGEELYAALTSSLDPGFLESCLTPKQVTLLQDYQRSLQEKQNHDIQEELRNALSKQEAENSLERKVISLIKIRVADYYGRQKGNPPCTSMLTIWRPAEDLIAQLIEGKRFQLTNLSASGARFQWNSSSAQLASTRSTRYLERQTQGDILHSIYRPREAVSLQSLASGCHQSMYGEVDVVGLVAAVKGGSGGLQKVYLTDEHCHVVEVRFWNGLKSHHIEDVVRPGKFITASNLQVRGAETSVLHATELSLFSVNPKAKLLQHSLVELKNKIKDVTAILHLVEESIDQLTNRQIPQRPSVKVSGNNSTISSSGYSSASNSFVASPSGKEQQKRDENDLGQGVTHHWVPYEGKVSPSPVTPSSTTQRSQFTKGTTQGNDGVSQFCKRNLVTPNQILIANPSEDKVSAKKKEIQRRSSLLARIPSPPPLTPLPDCTTSELRKEFRTPVRDSTPTPVRGSTPKPVRGSTPSYVPMLSFDMTQTTSAEKKTMAMSRDSKLPSSTVREEPGCALVFKENAEDGSIEDSLTATQAARLEVGQLTDVEIKELAGSWSQPLSYSSSDENTPEMKEKPCERDVVEELKGKDGELHVSVDVDKCKSLEEKTVMKNDSCELKAGEENTVLDGSRNCRGQPAQIGGRSLSRKKRERVKQEAVDVTSVKRRKLWDDSCQMEFQSENHQDSLRLLTERGYILGAKDFGGLKSSKPERDRNVGVRENEINVRTSDKNVGGSDCNSSDHATISEETAKSHKNLSGNIQNVSIEDICHGDRQAKEKEDTPETVTENMDSQTNVSSSVAQKGGRKGRKFQRSNVNLALLDETNLQVSPENDRLSSRLRRRSRPSYKE